MKKQYIIPTMEIVEITVNSLICTSLNMTGDPASNGDALAPDMPLGMDIPGLTTPEELLGIPGI